MSKDSESTTSKGPDAKSPLENSSDNTEASITNPDKCKICGHPRSSHSANGICFESICGCTDFNDEHGRITERKRPIKLSLWEWFVLIAVIIVIIFSIIIRI